MDDGGYDRPELWLSDGWVACRRNGWTAPLYWESRGRALASLHPRRDARPSTRDEPVCHVSYLRGRRLRPLGGRRLATEAEWETAAVAQAAAIDGNFLESGRLPSGIRSRPARSHLARRRHSSSATSGSGRRARTSPYPGFRPAAGALGEYNGKFMCNQMVLRGGSCATPRSHIRPTYRQLLPARVALAVLGDPAGPRRMIEPASPAASPRRYVGLGRDEPVPPFPGRTSSSNPRASRVVG